MPPKVEAGLEWLSDQRYYMTVVMPLAVTTQGVTKATDIPCLLSGRSLEVFAGNRIYSGSVFNVKLLSTNELAFQHLAFGGKMSRSPMIDRMEVELTGVRIIEPSTEDWFKAHVQLAALKKRTGAQ